MSVPNVDDISVILRIKQRSVYKAHGVLRGYFSDIYLLCECASLSRSAFSLSCCDTISYAKRDFLKKSLSSS